MKITAIRRQKQKRDRLNLYVDGDFRLAVAEEVALRARVRSGCDCDDRLLASLQADDIAWRTRAAALNLIAYRPRSERELRSRLLRKKLPAPAIDHCIDELRRTRLVDDRAFAGAFARGRIQSRPKARAALLAELRARGIDPATATEAVREALADCSIEHDADLARNAARKFNRRSGEAPMRARNRLYGYLARRGFSPDSIRQVIDEYEF